MFLHTFNTWLIANLLHPLMCMAFGLFTYGHDGILFYADIVKGYVMVFVLSLLFSLPALLIGWFLLGISVLSDYTPFARLLLWITWSSMLVIAETLMISWIIGESITLQTFSWSIPGILAVNAAIVIRYKQFQNLISSLQTNDHENSRG